jgi:PhnB protein
MSKVQPVPPGMTGVTPHLVVKGASKAIDYYRKAFGATELSRFEMPDGSIMHAAIKIGEGTVYLADENKEWGNQSPQSLGGSPVLLALYVPDVDAFVKRAVEAGAEIKMPVNDQFWGDRYGMIADPFGHLWEVSTHQEDVSPDEMKRRGMEMISAMK